MLSAAGGSQAAAQTLLEAGADPERLNLVSATALEIAAASGHSEVRSFLADKTALQSPAYIFRVNAELDIHQAAGAGDLARHLTASVPTRSARAEWFSRLSWR